MSELLVSKHNKQKTDLSGCKMTSETHRLYKKRTGEDKTKTHSFTVQIIIVMDSPL